MNCEDLKQFDIIVDVRSPAEHRQARIKGSVSMPLQEIHKHIDELEKYEKIGIYCRSGQRSGAVVQFLNNNGHVTTNIGSISNFLSCLEY